MAVEKILLGYGIFSIGGVPVGLTRGGGMFSVENEFRLIEADGDMGPVKDRIVLDRQVAKLTLNALTAFGATDMQRYYPTMKETTGKVTSTLKISSTDYQEVKWEGKTIDNKSVTITLDNALNMGNIELTLEDKNEVVPELEFTATFKEDARTTAPWNVNYGSVV